MQYSFADSKDIPLLSTLWQELYNDSTPYINTFFEKRFSTAKAMIAKEKDEIASVMYLLPCELKGGIPAYYWYAGGTAKKWRNMGVFRNLIAEIKAYSKKEGRANLCVPGAGLFEFYKKEGLIYPFLAQKFSFVRNEFSCCCDEARIEKATMDDFYYMSLSQGSSVWDRSAIEYALLENEISGGKNIKIISPFGSFPILVQRKENEAILSSYTLPQELFLKFEKNFFDYLHCDFISFILQGNACSPKFQNKFPVGLCDCSIVNRNSILTFSMI